MTNRPSPSAPSVSVLVPTFNRAELLGACLDSLLAQTLPASQILVVDDGSTDGTARVLERYRGSVQVLETRPSGKSAAINAGLAKVTGDYLWIFDDDDVALGDALERMVRPLEEHPEHGFSFGSFYYTASDPVTHRLGRVLHELEIPDLESRGFLVPLLEDNFLGGAALLARTACYRQTGPFDPALTRSQDYDMAVRIARRFSGIRVAGKPTFHYRQHEGLRGKADDRFEANIRFKKWLHYDRIIFEKLYRELPLEAYLKPGADPARFRRQALLQRLTVMTSKLALTEALTDLRELEELAEDRPFSELERLIAGRLVHFWLDRSGDSVEFRKFPQTILERSHASKAIARLRLELILALLTQWWKRPQPWRARESARRIRALLQKRDLPAA